MPSYQEQAQAEMYDAIAGVKPPQKQTKPGCGSCVIAAYSPACSTECQYYGTTLPCLRGVCLAACPDWDVCDYRLDAIAEANQTP